MTRLLLEKVPDPPATVEVAGEELHYLTRVRRHAVGDPVEVRDACGRRFAGRVAALSRQSALVEILSRLAEAPEPWPVTMVVAIPKGTRLDDVIRKLGELGIDELVPVIAARTNTKPGPGRLDRWRRIAAESTRQCGRGEPLAVREIEDLAAALEARRDAVHRLILDPAASGPGLTGALAGGPEPGRIVIAIGPEGGFTAAELEAADRLGYAAAGLGPSVLRIETAAIAAATLAVAFLGGFD